MFRLLFLNTNGMAFAYNPDRSPHILISDLLITYGQADVSTVCVQSGHSDTVTREERMFGRGIIIIIFYTFGPWLVGLRARNLWIQKADCNTSYTCRQESVLGPGPLIV